MKHPPQTAHSEHNDITVERLILMIEMDALTRNGNNAVMNQMDPWWLDAYAGIDDLRMKPGTPFEVYFEWLCSWLDFSLAGKSFSLVDEDIIARSLSEWEKANETPNT